MEFELFGKLHILYLIGYSLLFTVLYFVVAHSSDQKRVMRDIATIILLIKCGEIFIRYRIIGEAWYELLPLHLCNIVLIFAVFGSIFRFYPFLDANFFWGIGALFAIITPCVKDPFPSFFNISFFSTHFFILFNMIVEYRLFKYRPTASSWLGCFFGLNLIAASVFFINDTLGTNYLYINRKPEFASPIDFLGPWPHYIIYIEVIYLVLTLILLLLFRKKNKIKFSNSY